MKKHDRLRKTTTNGFTLAELLIVVAIIGVLVAVGIPIFTSQLGKARAAVCLSNKTSAEHMFVIERMTDLTSTNAQIRKRVEAAVFGGDKTGCPVHDSKYTWTYYTFEDTPCDEDATTGVRAVIQCSVAGHGSNTPGGGGSESDPYSTVYDSEGKAISGISLAGGWKKAEYEGSKASYKVFEYDGKFYYLLVGDMSSANFKKYGEDNKLPNYGNGYELNASKNVTNENMRKAVADYLNKIFKFDKEIESISYKNGQIRLTFKK